ncbi:unnamed protein product [Leuciscus chuanchicus]
MRASHNALLPGQRVSYSLSLWVITVLRLDRVEIQSQDKLEEWSKGTDNTPAKRLRIESDHDACGRHDSGEHEHFSVYPLLTHLALGECDLSNAQKVVCEVDPLAHLGKAVRDLKLLRKEGQQTMEHLIRVTHILLLMTERVHTLESEELTTPEHE